MQQPDRSSIRSSKVKKGNLPKRELADFQSPKLFFGLIVIAVVGLFITQEPSVPFFVMMSGVLITLIRYQSGK